MDDRIADVVIILAYLAVIIARLCSFITWAWLWIFAPIWMPLCIGILIAFFILLLFGAKELHNEYKIRRK